MWAWVVIALFVAAIAHTWRLRSQAADPYALAETERPSDLAGARVVESNTRLAMRRPFALHGVPDVIYELPDGSLLLREDKSGVVHAFADRIEISVYGAILRHNPPTSLRRRRVNEYGYIRYGIPGKTNVRWQRVRLYTDAELLTLIQRHQELRSGTPSRMTTDPGYCSNVCPHFRSRCSGAP